MEVSLTPSLCSWLFPLWVTGVCGGGQGIAQAILHLKAPPLNPAVPVVMLIDPSTCRQCFPPPREPPFTPTDLPLLHPSPQVLELPRLGTPSMPCVFAALHSRQLKHPPQSACADHSRHLRPLSSGGDMWNPLRSPPAPLQTLTPSSVNLLGTSEN